MKLERIELFSFHLPLVAAMRVKGRDLRHRDGILIRVTDDKGQSGWGEASPLPGFSGEEISDVREALQELAARHVGHDAAWDTIDVAELPPSARFGIQSALLNLVGTPAASILSSSASARIALNGLLAGELADMEAQAERLIAAGYTCVKIKVGRKTPSEDAELVRHMAARLGTCRIRLDANQAWSLEDAKAFHKALGGTLIDYLEEPLRNVTQIPDLIAATGLPIALDETIGNTPMPVWSAWVGIKALVVKPTLLGGLQRVKRLADVATEKGFQLVISSSFESGIGLGMLVQLAAAFSGEQVPVGLDTYRWLSADVLEERLPLHGPVVEVSRVEALTRRVKMEQLQALKP